MKKPFRTSDISFAAALLCLGKKLVDTEEVGYGKSEFLFANDGKFEDLYSDFINGNLKVDPQQLTNHIRALKGMVKRSSY